MNIKNLTRNPLFYTSLVLAILLGFQTYNFVSAYTPPPGPPTQGDPAQPLDAGPTTQTKAGALTIVGTTTIGKSAKPNIMIDGGISGLQKISFQNSGTDIGEIYYSGGKLWAKNGGGTAFEIGTGSGVGASIGWSRNTAMNVVYPTTLGDSVYVGNPTGGLTLGNIRSLSPVPASSPTAAAHLVMAVGAGRWWQIGTTINAGNSDNLFISTGGTADQKRQLTIDGSGNLKAVGIIESTGGTGIPGGFKFPDNTIQTTAGSIINLSKEYTVSGINANNSGSLGSQIDLILANKGFCFITGVGGDFEGTGESVKIVSGTSRQSGHTTGDVYWQLKLTSGRPSGSNQELSASARCAGTIDASEQQGVVTPTPTWRDVTGAGNVRESCVDWLTRTGQAGTQRRVLWPNGNIYNDKCTTEWPTPVGGRTNYGYGQAADTAISETAWSVSSVPGDTLNYIGTSPGAKTQVLR